MYIFLISLTLVICFIFFIMFLVERYLDRIDSDCVEVEDEEDDNEKEKS